MTNDNKKVTNTSAEFIKKIIAGPITAGRKNCIGQVVRSTAANKSGFFPYVNASANVLNDAIADLMTCQTTGSEAIMRDA